MYKYLIYRPVYNIHTKIIIYRPVYKIPIHGFSCIEKIWARA